MSDELKIIAVAVLAAAVAIIAYIEWHGYSLEYDGRPFHAGCGACDMYRRLHMFDSDFQLREINRALWANSPGPSSI